MKLPSNQQWNSSLLDITTNMAMDTKSKATIAKKAVSIMGEYSDAGFQFPLALNFFDNKYIILTSGSLFSFTLPSYSLTKETSAPSLFLGSDAVVFNGQYVMSSGTTGGTIHAWDGGVFNLEISGLATNAPQPLDVFGKRLVVGTDNEVRTYNTGFVAGTALILPTEYRVTTIRVVNNFIYIGTQNKNGNNAKIFVWDGDSPLFNYEVEVGAPWVFSMTPYQSTVAVVTSAGQLGIVNGTTFQQLEAFPVYNNPHATWQNSGGLQINGKVFNRGMTTIGDTIYMNIDGEVDSDDMLSMKSGVWVYDPEIGLYHRASGTSDKVIKDNNLALADSTITTPAPHSLKTGDGVVFDAGVTLTGVSSNTKYYVKVVSDTEIKLAPTRKALSDARYLTITGTPTGIDTLVYAQNGDQGTITATSGFIAPLSYLQTPEKILNTEILWGSRIQDKEKVNKFRAFSFTDSLNVGQFTTKRIYTDNIDQSWKEIYPFLDGLFTETEKILVKVQYTHQNESSKLNGVWLNTNTINSTTPDDFQEFRDIELGDEIMLVDGYGRGQSAHVEEINTSGATVSLTLDVNLGTINKNCEFYFTTFKKIGTYTKEHKTKEKIRAVIDNVSSPWIVLKFELHGYQTAVNMVELSNAIHKQTN